MLHFGLCPELILHAFCSAVLGVPGKKNFDTGILLGELCYLWHAAE